MLPALFLAFLLAGHRPDPAPADLACGASTDTVVHAEALPPDRDALEKALSQWASWMETNDGAFCMTLVLTPIDGRDGEPVVQPLLIVFKLAPQPTQSDRASFLHGKQVV